MDDISQQLMNEILSLESYIERTEDRLLATKWTPDLLDPLEAQGEELAEANLPTSEPVPCSMMARAAMGLEFDAQNSIPACAL